MFFWRGLSIRNKFRFLKISWLLMILLVGGTGLWAAKQIQYLLANQTETVNQMRSNAELDKQIALLRTHVYRIISLGQEQTALVSATKQTIITDSTLLKQKLLNLHGQEQSKEMSVLVSQLEPEIQNYILAVKKIINEPSNEGKYDFSTLQTMETIYQKLSSNLNQIISLQNSEIQGYQQTSQDTFSISVAYVTIAALIGVVVVYVVMRSLSGIIIRAMVRLAHVAERISEGDLSESVQRRNFYRKGNEELQTLINSMDKMQRSLTNLVLEVRENANGVAIASLQIAAGNNDLSERTDKQARSVQNTTASVGEFKDMIQSTASSAREASGLADKASQIAECGGEVVGRVVSTMHNITNSSKKIGDIVGAIDSIAFQTNILALNAAVEASRAGEQGKGFAVVAAEVRQLALRSASAAKEISDIVQSSVHEIDTGSKLVNEAGSTMQEIVAAVSSVTTMINDICQQSSFQADTVAEVTEAIVEIDQNTRQNASLVQESAAAAVLLKENADKLTQAVAAFRF